HRRGITGAEAGLQNPQIAAGAALEARAKLGEQTADGRVIAQAIERETTTARAVFLRERDQRLYDAAQVLRLRQRGAGGLVDQQGGRHVAVHRAPVRRGAAELAARISVTHRETPFLLERRDRRRRRRRRRLFTAQPGRGPIVEAHAERQAVLLEHFLDL